MAIEIELPDGTILEAPDDADPSTVAKAYLAKNQQPANPPSPSVLQQAGRQLGLAGRSVVEGAVAVPGLLADGTMAAFNLATGQRNQMPSEAFRGAVTDKVFPKPESGAEKFSTAVMSTLAGAKIGIPGVKAQKPAAAPVTQQQQVLKASQAEGYVVPPTTTNPTMVNRTLEGMAGKLTTAQAASAKNQAVTNRQVRKALELAEETQITRETLDTIRENAGQVYKQIAAIGEIGADDVYRARVANLSQQAGKIAASFPDAKVGARAEIDDLVASMQNPAFKSDDAIEYVKQLRDASKGNLSRMQTDPSKKALGRAQRQAADIIEDQISRHLRKSGQGEVARNFNRARQLIAKTYTVEAALNPATGNVSAIKLGQQLAKGKPLSGELKQVAQFGQAFPKAAREFNESLPGISPLDYYGAAGLGTLANPAFFAIPAARMGVRAGLLSPLGQRLATPTARNGLSPETLAGLAAFAQSVRQSVR